MIPKFRAWLINAQLMVDVEEISFYSKTISYIEDDYVNVEQRWVDLDLDDIVLMQSTGLKDKNGVEIFEGDIVENTTQTVYLGHKFEVTWNENYAAYQLMNNGLGSNIPLMQDFMSYEVIGNIYENKELLND